MNECTNNEQWTHHHRTPEIEHNVPSKLEVGILIGYVYLYWILQYRWMEEPTHRIYILVWGYYNTAQRRSRDVQATGGEVCL